jgi:hypothetical protein
MAMKCRIPPRFRCVSLYKSCGEGYSVGNLCSLAVLKVMSQKLYSIEDMHGMSTVMRA